MAVHLQRRGAVAVLPLDRPEAPEALAMPSIAGITGDALVEQRPARFHDA